MQTYLHRLAENEVREDLQDFPIVAILGSRQCGKSTLVKQLGKDMKDFLYLDLEKPSDFRKLEDPELFFRINKEKVICLDEIQLRKDLFPILRSVVDEKNRNGQFILLGSASRELVASSAESLAGRISFINLTPLSFNEASQAGDFNINNLWFRGGYPDSFLARKESSSQRWRDNFIKTYIEKDLPKLGIKVSAIKLQRFLSMCTHFHGQTLNAQKLGQALDISYKTVQHYIDIFEQSFIVRRLMPYEGNLKKRLVKSPKIYIRDSGIFHSLLEVENLNELMGHPNIGSSWEGFVIENILTELKGWKGYFYRTGSGNEIDLVLKKGLRKIAIEVKLSTVPIVGRGFWQSLDDLEVDEAWIIAPVEEKYALKRNVFVGNLGDFLKEYVKE